MEDCLLLTADTYLSLISSHLRMAKVLLRMNPF